MRAPSDRLVILTHGLEGSSQSSYILRFAQAFNRNGWDVLAWNLRGCSGEQNRKPYWYHSGKSSDLVSVFSHALFKKRYQKISLIGFSLGGNITLKFLGEEGEQLGSLIESAVVFSVPCDLKSSAFELAKWKNGIYMRNFRKLLHQRIREKAKQFPEEITVKGLRKIRTFEDFDRAYTAPLNGFANERDYWEKSSSKCLIPDIRIRTLIVNAQNDPMLGPDCYPKEIAEKSEYVTLEIPKNGGHVGFLSRRGFWDTERSLEWLQDQDSQCS